MRKQCELGRSLFQKLIPPLKSINQLVKTSREFGDFEPHFETISTVLREIDGLLCSIDTIYGPTEMIQTHDFLITTTSRMTRQIAALTQCVRDLIATPNALTQHAFDELSRALVRPLDDMRQGMDQLKEGIDEMSLDVFLAPTRKPFQDAIEICRDIEQNINHENKTKLSASAQTLNDAIVSFLTLAMNERATKRDHEGVMLFFKNFIIELKAFINSPGSPSPETKRATKTTLLLVKRSLRDVAMGLPVGTSPAPSPIPTPRTPLNLSQTPQSSPRTNQQPSPLSAEQKAHMEARRRRDLYEKQQSMERIREDHEREVTNRRIEEERMKAEKKMNERLSVMNREIQEVTRQIAEAMEENKRLAKQYEELASLDVEQTDSLRKLEEKTKQRKKLETERNRLMKELKSFDEGKKPKHTLTKKNMIKGDFGRTIKRQQMLSKEYNLGQLTAVEMRKQLEIDRAARMIEEMGKDDEETNLEDIIDALHRLSETLDLDSAENHYDVYSILRQTDFNSIALRITSPKFRISSSISYIGHYISENELESSKDSFLKMIEEYEKQTFYGLAEKMAEIATAVEDTMCFGSLLIVSDPERNKSYMHDLLGSCRHAQEAITIFMEQIPQTYLSGSKCCSSDDTFTQKYRMNVLEIPVPTPMPKDKSVDDILKNVEKVELVKQFNGVMTRIKDHAFATNERKKYIDASLGVDETMRGGLIYDMVRSTSTKMKSIIGQLLALSSCIAHLKPKDLKNLQNSQIVDLKDSGQKILYQYRLFDAKEFDSRCEKIDKDVKQQFQREAFYSINLDVGYDAEILYLFEIASLCSLLLEQLQNFVDVVYSIDKMRSVEQHLVAQSLTIIDPRPLAEEIITIPAFVKFKGEKLICASVNQMLFHATKSLDFRAMFLKCYRSFMSPSEVMSKLTKTFLSPVKLDPAIRLSVFKTISWFLGEGFDDFDAKTITLLKNFITTLQDPQNKIVQEMKIGMIVSTLERDLDEKETKLQYQIAERLVPQISFLIPNEPYSPTVLVQLSDAQEVASQLTLIAFTYFSAIRPSELFNKAYENEKLIPQAYNVVQLNRYTQSVTDWVIAEILFFCTPENRVKAAIHFIQIAEHLFHLNNFQMLYAILLAFDPRTGLKMLDELPSRVTKQYAALRKYVQDTNNYKKYRQTIAKITDPCVPLMPVLFKDLDMAETENPKTVKFEKTGVDVINFRRCEVLVDLIDQTLSLNRRLYTIAMTDPLHTFLVQVVSMPTKMRDKLAAHWSKLFTPN